MDEVEELRSRVRRGPWRGKDLNDVFAQANAIETIPGGVATDIGLPPETTRYITSYVRNGDFASLPPDATGTISDTTNKLPDWRFVTVQGSSITAAMVADASAAAGYVLRVSCASGTASDEVYFEQIVPIMSSRKSSWVSWANAHTLAASAATVELSTKLVAQYLKQDETTTTGSASTYTSAFSATATEWTVTPGTDGVAPGDAAFLRVRFGVLRNNTTATAASVDFTNIFLNTGNDAVLVADDTDSAEGPGGMTKTSGTLSVSSDISDTSGKPRIDLSGDQNSIISYGTTYGARAVRTSNQSISNATDTSIDFNATDLWDIDSLHDTSTDNERLRLNITGWWLIGGGAEFENNSSGDRSCFIEVNGKDGAGTKLHPWSRYPASTADETALNVTVMRYFDLTDYICLTVRQNSGGALNVTSATLWAQLMMAA